MGTLINHMSPYVLNELPDPRRQPIDSYNKISTFLYLGNIDSLEDQDKFYLIVNCTKHIPLAKKCKETIRIPVDDHPTECDNMIKFITNTHVLKKIHECRMNQQPVLIHCHAGMQRSAAVLACYLVHYYKMDPYEAIRFIQSKRPIAFYPQANFLKVIQHEYQSKLAI
jgi:protein tyrosine/serine phosphatase